MVGVIVARHALSRGGDNTSLKGTVVEEASGKTSFSIEFGRHRGRGVPQPLDRSSLATTI